MNQSSVKEINKELTNEDEKYLLFEVEEQSYAVLVKDILEILIPTPLTPVPNVSNCIIGVMNLRGKIIPVVDLKDRFGLGVSEIGESSCYVVVEFQNYVVGILVDKVLIVHEFPNSKVQKTVQDDKCPYIIGIAHLGNMNPIILSVEKLLAPSIKDV